MKNYFLGIFILFLLTACSGLEIVTPNPRTEVPELPGAGVIHFQAEGTNAHQYEATTDASARPPTFNRKLEKAGAFVGSIAYSPIDPLAFGFEIDPVHINFAAYAKYQFLGGTFLQGGPGNFSGMVYLRAGGGSRSKSGNQNGTFGAGGYPWKGTITNQMAMSGLSFGYRFTESLMTYAGASYGGYWLKTNIDQESANGNAGGNYKDSAKGSAQVYGGGVAVNLGNALLLVGADYSFVNYNITSGELYDTTAHIGIIF